MKNLFLGALLFLTPVGLRAAEINVYAAASLTDALQEIGAAYEKQSGDQVVFNFGGSNVLQKQIEQGGQADLFVSADEAKMDALEKKELLLNGTRHSFLSNALVIIIRSDYPGTIKSAEDLAEAKQIALADPATVPAGIYAREYLTKKGLWEKVQPKVIPAENVRAALTMVESGNADAAIVYKTDAVLAKKATLALEVPAAEGPKISYPLAVLKAAPHLEKGKAFATWLLSEKAGAVFKKFGFLVLPVSAAQPVS